MEHDKEDQFDIANVVVLATFILGLLCIAAGLFLLLDNKENSKTWTLIMVSSIPLLLISLFLKVLIQIRDK